MSEPILDDIAEQLKMIRYIGEEQLRLQQEHNDHHRTANLIALYAATSRNAAADADNRLDAMTTQLLHEIRGRVQF